MIKPTMSHAANKAHLNELLIEYYEKQNKELECALKSVQSLISEAAETGFNCHEGDWAERLFYSQRETSNALKSN
tara:strand:+ start:501 stop:725 length:225 start_codon:yes stop_codon:yes gene_type:complete